jgi:hypothetical protein
LLGYDPLMSSSRTPSLPLTLHPAGVRDAVRAIEAHVMRDPSGHLGVRYRVHGDPGRLRIPAAREPRRADHLWRHTCFEIFIAAGAGAAYLELNFSPSGEWASYEFKAYRERRAADQEQGGPIAPWDAPTVTATRGEEELTLEAAVRLDCVRGNMPLKVALAAVIEDSSGALSYWALRHPPGKPDFHHPDSFALEI